MTLKSRGTLYEAAAVLFLLLWGAWLLFQPYLPGSDGYYLLDQTTEILKSGALRIKNNDPTPYHIAGLIKLGIQPELSVKLLLFFAGAFWLWMGRKSEIWFFFCITPLFIFHLVQFPKLTIAILLGIQAFLWAGKRNPILLAVAAGLFHPLGFCAWGLFKLKNWKIWAPWVGAFILAAALPLYGYFIRSQSFSLVPVGFKFVTDPHLPILFRTGFVCWLVWMASHLSALWMAFAFLAPSSHGELFGTMERWAFVILLFSPWIFKNEKWGWYWVPLVPVAGWLMLQQIPQYDYKPLEDLIPITQNLNLKMLVVDQTGKFYFTAKTGKDAYFFEPEDDWDKTTIWRVVQNVSPGALLPFMGESCAPGTKTWFAIRPDMLLMREDCWEAIRSKINKDQNEYLYDIVWDNTINPCKKRPLFLGIRNE
jgi:hypothetical protein